MENPYFHTRAMNVIGKVLDEDKEIKDMVFSSLEYRIATRLEEEGLLTEKAFDTVGIEGRFDTKP